jgi:hypothetical protein
MSTLYTMPLIVTRLTSKVLAARAAMSKVQKSRRQAVLQDVAAGTKQSYFLIWHSRCASSSPEASLC